jgi:hypothetical protein
LHGLTLGGATVTAYVGLIALAANALVAVFVNLLVPARRMVTGPDANYQR